MKAKIDKPSCKRVNLGSLCQNWDADPFIAVLTECDITPVIPPKVNRKVPRS